MPIIGFRARLSVNDGASDAEQFFNNVKVTLPAREVGEFEDLTLYTSTKNRTFKPTLVDNGTVNFEAWFTKAEYARLVALLGVEGKTWKVYSPDEDGATATLTPGVYTLVGWLKSIGEVSFEKATEVKVPFAMRVNSISVADGSNDTAYP